MEESVELVVPTDSSKAKKKKEIRDEKSCQDYK
jgi:hypothetical protein